MRKKKDQDGEKKMKMGREKIGKETEGEKFEEIQEKERERN